MMVHWDTKRQRWARAGMRSLTPIFLIFFFAATSAQAASDTPAFETPSKDRVGINLAATLAVLTAEGEFDYSGAARPVNGNVFNRWWMMELEASYSLVSPKTLTLGASMPLIWRTMWVQSAGAGDSKQASTGVGDLSLFGRYVGVLTQHIDLGGEVRVKLSTGNLGPAEEIARGSGYGNLKLMALARARFDRLTLYGDLGYVGVFPAAQDTRTTINPGNIRFLNLAGGYLFHDFVEPRVRLFVATAGETQTMSRGLLTVAGSTTPVPGTGGWWLAIGLEGHIRLGEGLSAHLGIGAPLSAQGINLPYGFPLAGSITNANLAVHGGIRAML